MTFRYTKRQLDQTQAQYDAWARDMAARPDTSRYARGVRPQEIAALAERIERIVADGGTTKLKPETAWLVFRALRAFAAQPTREQIIRAICGLKECPRGSCYGCTGKANAILHLIENTTDTLMP